MIDQKKKEEKLLDKLAKTERILADAVASNVRLMEANKRLYAVNERLYAAAQHVYTDEQIDAANNAYMDVREEESNHPYSESDENDAPSSEEWDRMALRAALKHLCSYHER